MLTCDFQLGQNSQAPHFTRSYFHISGGIKFCEPQPRHLWPGPSMVFLLSSVSPSDHFLNSPISLHLARYINHECFVVIRPPMPCESRFDGFIEAARLEVNVASSIILPFHYVQSSLDLLYLRSSEPCAICSLCLGSDRTWTNSRAKASLGSSFWHEKSG